MIGNGSFGVVYQAKLCETGEMVAIKKVLQVWYRVIFLTGPPLTMWKVNCPPQICLGCSRPPPAPNFSRCWNLIKKIILSKDSLTKVRCHYTISRLMGGPAVDCKCLQDKRFKNRELQIMRRLDHCNIVSLLYFFYTSGEKKVFYFSTSSILVERKRFKPLQSNIPSHLMKFSAC